MILIKKKSFILSFFLLIVFIYGLILCYGLTLNYLDIDFYETNSIPTDSFRILTSIEKIDFIQISFLDILLDFNNIGYKAFIYYFFSEDSIIDFYKLFFFNFLVLIFTYKLVLSYVDSNNFFFLFLFPIFSFYSISPNKDFYPLCFSVFLFHYLINKNYILIFIYSVFIFLMRAHIGVIGFFVFLKMKIRFNLFYCILIIFLLSNFLNIYIDPSKYYVLWLTRNPESNYFLSKIFYILNDLSLIPLFGVLFQAIKGFLNFFLSFFSLFDSHKFYDHFFLTVSIFSNSLLFFFFVYSNLKYKKKFINMNKPFYFGILFSFFIISISSMPQPRYFLFLFFPMLMYLNLFRRFCKENESFK